MIQNCPRCGFDVQADSLLRVIHNKAGVDPESMPEHLAGYHNDLDSLVIRGYAERAKSGWFIPTNKYKQRVKSNA